MTDKENPAAETEAANEAETAEAEKTAEAQAPEETSQENAKAETQEAPAKDEAAELREQLAAEKDRYLRLAAEYDNYRRRSAKERDNIYSDVRADTLTKILPVLDNLERALAHETADEAYRKGVEMTYKQFMDCLAQLGVTPIEAVGKTFDPNMHNAVMHLEDPEKGEQEIVAEFQKGFKIGDRVIRFSMVQVAN